jgi:hypothetical protein
MLIGKFLQLITDYATYRPVMPEAVAVAEKT